MIFYLVPQQPAESRLTGRCPLTARRCRPSRNRPTSVSLRRACRRAAKLNRQRRWSDLPSRFGWGRASRRTRRILSRGHVPSPHPAHACLLLHRQSSTAFEFCWHQGRQISTRCGEGTRRGKLRPILLEAVLFGRSVQSASVPAVRIRSCPHIQQTLHETPHGSQAVVSGRFRRLLTVSTRTLLSIACLERTPLITQRSRVQIPPPQPKSPLDFRDLRKGHGVLQALPLRAF